MMLSSAEFAPYRQAALSVEAVKRRVEMVQKERAESATKRAEQLKREREKKRQARPNKKRTPIQEAADRLEVDEDMLRAVAAAMTMSEAQVDAACQADPTAGEKLRGVREGAAFGEIREACVKLGLVDEASKEMKAAPVSYTHLTLPQQRRHNSRKNEKRSVKPELIRSARRSRRRRTGSRSTRTCCARSRRP